MKEYNIIFPGGLTKIAYKDRKAVIQKGLNLNLINNFTDPGFTLTLNAVNSKGFITTDLRLAVPATSSTLREIIKVLQEFKDDVDNGNELYGGTFNEILVKEEN